MNESYFKVFLNTDVFFIQRLVPLMLVILKLIYGKIYLQINLEKRVLKTLQLNLKNNKLNKERNWGYFN